MERTAKPGRIWELDALRGIAILCVILIHLVFDLTYFLRLPLELGAAFLLVQAYGGVVFVILSGLCATLGVIIPSIVIIFIISLFLDRFMSNRYVAYAFVGIKCAVAFLILRAGFDMLSKLPRKALPICTFVTVLGLMLAFELLSVSFSSIFFILAGGVLGILVYGVFSKNGRAK